MDILLAHIPHIALLLGLALLFVRMEIGERRMRVAVAGGEEGSAEQVRAMGVRGAMRTLLLMLLFSAIAVLMVQAFRGELPSAFIVVDYLAAGGALAIWLAWSAPSSLAPGMRERLGGPGRGIVRLAVLIVALGGVVIAGMALSHGVILPEL